MLNAWFSAAVIGGGWLNADMPTTMTIADLTGQPGSGMLDVP
jgi:hypothetical protein